MSAEKPTERQIRKLNRLHRKNFGYMVNLLTHERISDTPITFCEECQVKWPCKTMKCLGEN